jgi:pimeloyl-ACP methyl ester carboxylesterase
MPATQYAEVDDLNIAYQVCGSGPVDLVYVPGLYNHVEAAWDLPGFPEWMERLVRFARVITFDKRGCGMSDPVVTPPTLEQRMADVGAVMDAAGCRTAWLLGVSEGGPLSSCLRQRIPSARRVSCSGVPTRATAGRRTIRGGQGKRPGSRPCGSGRRIGEILRESPRTSSALR